MFIPQSLYNQILPVFPIPCVDLIVRNKYNEILMLKRNNEPAQGQWWFPGGRVNHGESRLEAAIRKLKEECGIESYQTIEEVGTFDLFLETSFGYTSHGITTVFEITGADQKVELDKQSEEFAWKKKEFWLEVVKNDFLKTCLLTH